MEIQADAKVIARHNSGLHRESCPPYLAMNLVVTEDKLPINENISIKLSPRHNFSVGLNAFAKVVSRHHACITGVIWLTYQKAYQLLRWCLLSKFRRVQCFYAPFG